LPTRERGKTQNDAVHQEKAWFDHRSQHSLLEEKKETFPLSKGKNLDGGGEGEGGL